MNATERSDDFDESAGQWASSLERESPMRAESAEHPTFPSIPFTPPRRSADVAYRRARQLNRVDREDRTVATGRQGNFRACSQGVGALDRARPKHQSDSRRPPEWGYRAAGYDARRNATSSCFSLGSARSRRGGRPARARSRRRWPARADRARSCGRCQARATSHRPDVTRSEARPLSPKPRENGWSAVTPPPAESVTAIPSAFGAPTRAGRRRGPAATVWRARSGA